MNSTKSQGIIFDLDGTLLNTLTDLKNSLNAALRIHGLPERTTEEVRRFVGNGIAKLVARAIENGSSNPDYQAVLNDMRRIYAEKSNETTAPYPGIPEMLEALSAKGCLLAVVSNKPDAQVRSLCRIFFGDCIQTAIGQREGIPLKPAPDSVFAAADALGLPLSACTYVGDSEVDVQTARNAGVPCVSVLWGFRDMETLLSNGAVTFAHTPAEMMQMF